MTSDQINSMSRDQLRQAAKEAQIKGRGSMNKTELQEALRLHHQVGDQPEPTCNQNRGHNPLSNRTRKLNRLQRRANKLSNNNTNLRIY